MKDIFESHPVSVLKKEISKTNIKGYSKMKKAEVIELMMKNKDRFSYIKMAEKKPQKKPDKKIKLKPEKKPDKKIKLKSVKKPEKVKVKPEKKPDKVKVKQEKKPEKKDEDEDLIENWDKPISNVLLEQNYKNINKKIVGIIERQKFVSLDRLINLFKPDLMKKLFNKYKGQFVLDGLIRFVKYNDNYNRRIQFDKFKDYFETKMKGGKLLTLSQTGMKMSTMAKSGGMSEELQKVIRDNWKRNYEGK